jgi:hypothetical protein
MEVSMKMFHLDTYYVLTLDNLACAIDVDVPEMVALTSSELYNIIVDSSDITVDGMHNGTLTTLDWVVDTLEDADADVIDTYLSIDVDTWRKAIAPLREYIKHDWSSCDVCVLIAE